MSEYIYFTTPKTYDFFKNLAEEDRILFAEHHKKVVALHNEHYPDLSYDDYIKSIENRSDFAEFFGYKNGQFDFYIPFSGEFRGVCELYSMVMLKLIFIFLCLIALALFIIARVIFVYAVQWDKVKKTFVEEYRILSFFEALYLTRMEYDLRARAKGRGIPLEHVDKFPNNIWFRLRKYMKIEEISGLKSVSLKIGGFFIKGASSFLPNSFWIYYSKLEFLWTLVPCIILLFISVPSFTLALSLDESHKPVSWIKVLANQWFWVYETSTFGEDIVIYSNIVYGTDLSNNSLRAIEADAVVTLVNNKFNRLLVTSADVIHCWAVPSLGIKIDACPGRINTVSIMPTKCGVYYGQCSEICGVNHGFMPIVVEVVV